MANLSKESIKKLRAVKAAILAEPELYDQRIYADEIDPCGSACCLAGWLIWNDSPKKFKELADVFGEFNAEAWKVLGVRETGWALFGTGNCWPEPFAESLWLARSKADKAKVAAARIEHFIKTDGRE